MFIMNTVKVHNFNIVVIMCSLVVRWLGFNAFNVSVIVPQGTGRHDLSSAGERRDTFYGSLFLLLRKAFPKTYPVLRSQLVSIDHARAASFPRLQAWHFQPLNWEVGFARRDEGWMDVRRMDAE